MSVLKRIFVLFFVLFVSLSQGAFAFEAGTYYLQTASGTYIDAWPAGGDNHGAEFKSESATAFRFTQVAGGYTIQNDANDNYLLYSTANNWATKMSTSASETNFAGVWTVAEDANGKIAISRLYNNTTYYLGNNNTNVNTGVYSGQTAAVWYTPLTEDPFRPFDADKYYTIKTGNPESYFVCADNATVLGRSADAPTYDNLDNYLWKIVGNNQNGYTLQNKATNLYAQNPATIADHQQIRMTANVNNASHFKFVNGVFQLASNSGWYLAAYSNGDNFISIHNNQAYSGSKITKLPMEKVAEPQSGANVFDGSGSVGLLHAAYYITNVNSEGKRKYDYVPEGKAWQMIMDVTHDAGQKASFNQYGSCILSSEGDPINTFYWNNFQIFEHTAPRKTLNFKSNKGDGNDHIIAQGHQVLTDNGYEDYRVIVRYDGGNVYLIRTIILDAEGNPTNQVFNNVWFAARVQNDISVMTSAIPAGTHLKSLQISIAEESNLLEDVEYAIQNDATEEYLSCHYQLGPNEHYLTADHASRFMIEFTNSNDLAYHDGDGGLHPTIYIKAEVWNEQTFQIEWKYLGADNLPVDNKANAIPYLYSDNSKMIVPIINTKVDGHITSETGTPWAIDGNEAWSFIFFGNYLVKIAKNGADVGTELFGGITYKRTPYRNDQFVALPTNAKQFQIPNTSEIGYSATITMDATMLRVNYTPLENTFYTIEDLDVLGTGSKLYYWNTNTRRLVTYSTTNSKSGQYEEWNKVENNETINLFGDCSKYTITKATAIPVKMNQSGDKYYGTIYCPNEIALPAGVTAYTLKAVLANGNYLLHALEDVRVLPANTAVVLISENNETNPSGDWAINPNGATALAGEVNHLVGCYEDITNPGKGAQAQSTIYMLSGKGKNSQGVAVTGIGFYPYSGANIPAFKAYHELEQPASEAPVRFGFQLEEDGPGISTGIEELNPSSPFKGDREGLSDLYYDILGRATAQPQKGHLYIHNGQKIMY